MENKFAKQIPRQRIASCSAFRFPILHVVATLCTRERFCEPG
jgi:hypothetical protein